MSRHRPLHHRDVHRATRREALLDAALEVIRHQGPGASMREMAAAAGITKPILYRYFGDRDGLLAAVADRFSDELVETLGAAMSAAPNDPRGRIEGGLDAFLRFMEDEGATYRFLTARAAAAGPTITSVVDRVSQPLSLIIGEEMRSLGADSGAAEPWAYGIVGMAHAAGVRWQANPTMPRQQLVAYLVALVWQGMAGFADAE
ncbi:MAG: TetR/AcrR family transcriptional regulator [Acidimicrobiales bacterium]